MADRISAALREANQRIMAAVDDYAHAMGSANWTNGYRTGGKDTPETYKREIAEWERVDVARRRVRRLVLRVLREARDGL